MSLAGMVDELVRLRVSPVGAPGSVFPVAASSVGPAEESGLPHTSLQGFHPVSAASQDHKLWLPPVHVTDLVAAWTGAAVPPLSKVISYHPPGHMPAHYRATYVERLALQGLFSVDFISRERCGHMSGLSARPMTAGLDEVREAGG
jgi:hypothetical protein